MGDLLSLPPLLVEKYLTAAERIADEAIVTPEERLPQSRRFALDLLEVGYNAKQQGDGWVALTSVEEDDLAALENVKAPGEYRLRARALGRAETPRPMELTFLLGEQPIETVLLTAEPSVYETRLRAGVGRQRFRVALRRIKDGLPPEKANLWREGSDQSGTALVEWLEVEGPFDTRDEELPAAHRGLLSGVSAADDRAAAGRRALERLLPRAFRRPATAEEIERLLALAEGAWRRGASFERGMEVALQAVLVSPAFLYRGQAASSSSDEGVEAVPIDEFALASRLSYFLWSSMPDDRLFELAGRGELRANLAAETARMLADPRSEALVANFFGQWLELRNLAAVSPDSVRFRKFDESLRDAMRRETELFCRTIVAEDRNVLEFLTADYTLVNERLAKHYGIAGVEGDEFRRVSLAGQPRRGVLTQASILTLTSNPTRTSPVKRGKWVLENLLGAPPPPPPARVPELEEQTGDVAALPLRQRMELHRENSLCASCHARMDPLGFALENFDAIGAWRTHDGGAPIDAAGELAGGEAFAGATEFVEVLARTRRDDFVRCLAEKLLTYALGRGLEHYDRCAVDAIAARARAEDYRFSALVRGVVESVPFQKQRGAIAAAATEKEKTTP
jgi:hypothetical protein